MTRRYLSLLLLLPALVISACRKDPVPGPQTKTGAPIQIMVVFAPGQLGDRGYADDVMDGINSLESFDDMMERDTVDVRFTAPYNIEDAQEKLTEWAKDPSHPFDRGNYERRLLVFTEPYMVGLLSSINNLLQPFDELLLLKLEEEDVSQVAARFNLGGRVHGLNISAEEPIKKYCKYMKWVDTDDDPHSNHFNIPVLRLFDSKAYPYRDGIVETIKQEMDKDTRITDFFLSDGEGEGIYASGDSQTVVEAAYGWASMIEFTAESSGCPFAIVDLGAGNAGWDYYLLGHPNGPISFSTLLLDASDSFNLNRCYIKRHFGMALMYWVYDWWDKPVGEMDAQVTHKDSFWFEDNIYYNEDE